MNTILCIALFAAGHMVRDGWPATGSTQLARLQGAIFCLAGALAVQPPLAALWLSLAIWIGFYTDMKHGEGQGAGAWRDVPFLFLSGLTSLAPLSLAAGWLLGWCYALIVLVGLIKPPLWFLAWAIRPDRWWAWLEPTRVAAIAFGAAIGAVVTILPA